MANPISEKEQKKISKWTQKLWERQNFISVVRSAEGSMATPESVSGLRPAK